MIGLEDAMYTYEYKNYFKILPSLFNWNLDKKRIKNGKKVPYNFVYSSNNNIHWMTQKELKTWIKSNLEKK